MGDMHMEDILDKIGNIFDKAYIIVLVLSIPIGFLIKYIAEKNKKSRIDFDEFSDIEKMKEQEIKDKATLNFETEKLNQLYHDAYIEESFNEMDKINNKVTSFFDAIADDKDKNNLKFGTVKTEYSETAARNAQKYMDHLHKNKSGVVYQKEYLDGPIVSNLRENGYNFDVELFKKWSRQIFGCIKEGKEEQLEMVKNFISEELYAKLEKQKKQFEKDGLEFITEDLIIEKCNLYDYARSLSKEEIKILIQASMKEYILQKETNMILRGSNEKSYTKKIIMTFVKKDTNEMEGLLHNCPNCGAEVTQTEFGKCRYCNTLVAPIRYNWTLTKFETL